MLSGDSNGQLDQTQRKLNEALALLMGKRVTMFHIDWRVGLFWTDPGAGQNLIIETPFTVGLPGDEDLVVPGEYGPSIARVIGLLGKTVVAAVTEPDILDLRLVFSDGSRLAIARNEPAWTGPYETEWEYRDGSGPDGLWIVH